MWFPKIANTTRADSLLPVLTRSGARQPRFVCVRNEDGTGLVRTNRYKLVMQPNSADGTLYDLQHDPDETTNVFGKPGSMGEQLRLQQLISERPTS